MILKKVRREDGRDTVYTASITAKEARLAGFLNEDGSSREMEKTVDEAAGTITLHLKEPIDVQTERLVKKASRMIMGLRAEGWDDKKIMDFVFWLESDEDTCALSKDK